MKIIGKLEEHGAGVNVRNNGGHTPLLYSLFSFWKRISMYGESHWRNFKTMNAICKHFLKYGPLAIEVARNGESVFHFLLKLLNEIFDRGIKEEVLQNIVELMKLFSPPVITHGVIVNKRDDQLKSPLQSMGFPLTFNRIYIFTCTI